MEKSISSLAELIESSLWAQFRSPMLGGDNLRNALGFASMEAFRQAVARGNVPVPLFEIEHRRGKHALVRDIAVWLAQQRLSATEAAGDSP